MVDGMISIEAAVSESTSKAKKEDREMRRSKGEKFKSRARARNAAK